MIDMAWAKAIAWADPVAIWVPAALVVLVAALGLTVAGSPPVRRGARRLWLGVIFVSGSLAVAGTVWQAQQLLPRRAAAAAAPQIAVLSARVAALQARLAKAQQPRRTRALASATATELAVDLKKSGSRQVVVSAIPGDLEAYDYATQLAAALRAAGWQAGGPEVTRAFGDIHAIGVNVFVNPAQTSDTAGLLTAAFGKLAIPYEPRVTPQGVVPAGDAVELFVGALPGVETLSVGPPPRQPAALPDVPIKAATAAPGGGETAGATGQLR
ncbi:MAG: hypothetical protein ACREE1_12425 [Stellaceae bacterium]